MKLLAPRVGVRARTRSPELLCRKHYYTFDPLRTTRPPPPPRRRRRQERIHTQRTCTQNEPNTKPRVDARPANIVYMTYPLNVPYTADIMIFHSVCVC